VRLIAVRGGLLEYNFIGYCFSKIMLFDKFIFYKKTNSLFAMAILYYDNQRSLWNSERLSEQPCHYRFRIIWSG